MNWRSNPVCAAAATRVIANGAIPTIEAAPSIFRRVTVCITSFLLCFVIGGFGVDALAWRLFMLAA
jgi:hypothetical protein